MSSCLGSDDRGVSWKKLQSALSLSGQKVADEDQEGSLVFLSAFRSELCSR